MIRGRFFFLPIPKIIQTGAVLNGIQREPPKLAMTLVDLWEVSARKCVA